MFRLTTILLFMLVGPLACAQDSLIMKSIYFGGGSYFIDEIQVEELQNFILDIDSIENYEIIIFSHTDNIGGKAYNQWLSKMRSQAVVNEILHLEIPKEIVKIRDFNFSNPLYTNTSHHGRVLNRRVDVILWPVVF